ncbi:hypothetical protein MSIM_25250 [Mycobacterium simiae]|nr:hypothetical protein MSIM_25250 [Mycobacterium simiae]
MTVEKLAEGIPVAGDMGREQLGVTAVLPSLCADAHRRTVTNRSFAGTSLARTVVSLRRPPEW